MAKDFPSPAEAPSPVLGGVEVERAPAPAPIVFVGGTGRSGTHVLSQLISRHARFGLVPVEVRFHTDADGFPGLLAGQVSPEQFVRRLRGFWWRGFQTSRMRGMYRFVDRERFEAAVELFEASHADDLEAACRKLFYDLLWFRATEGEKAAEGQGLIEQSTDSVAQAPTLARLFPEARFIHVVRDGRDASASRVAQTRGLVRPRTRVQGIEWWEERIRAIEAGAGAIPPERLLTLSLDELLRMPAPAPRCGRCSASSASPRPSARRRYFNKRMTPRAGQRRALEAWGLEAQGGADRGGLRRVAGAARGHRRPLRAAAAPHLRAPWRRPRSAGLRLRSGAMSSQPANLVFVGGTGRSGTHILSYLLDRHSRFHGVPIECRFHANPKGLADVVKGRTEPEDFLRKLRGYWWHRVRIGDRAYVKAKWRALGRGRVRGLHSIVGEAQFHAAADRFERSYDDDLLAASRNLFYELLQPGADAAGKPVLVEMSCFTIAAADGLAQIFPEARFVHSVRDGRDSGSSKVSLRQKPHHPTDVLSGIEFWADRLRQAEEGVQGLSAADRERLAVVSLDELVESDRERAYADLLAFLGISDEPAMRKFFDSEMNADAAHSDRWRKGLSAGEQEQVIEVYEATLERLEREGYHCAPVLRRSYERTLAASGA